MPSFITMCVVALYCCRLPRRHCRLRPSSHCGCVCRAGTFLVCLCVRVYCLCYLCVRLSVCLYRRSRLLLRLLRQTPPAIKAVFEISADRLPTREKVRHTHAALLGRAVFSHSD
jgi:hypothetical protein